MVIVTRHGKDWFKANWVYRQLAADVAARFSEDLEVASAVDRGLSFGALFPDELEPVLASRVVSAMRVVARETVTGALSSRKGALDESAHGTYVSAIEDLLSVIDE